jgi:hypothetical protein
VFGIAAARRRLTDTTGRGEIPAGRSNVFLINDSDCQKYVPLDAYFKSPCPPFFKGGTLFIGMCLSPELMRHATSFDIKFPLCKGGQGDFLLLDSIYMTTAINAPKINLEGFGGVTFRFYMKAHPIIAVILLSLGTACSPGADEISELFTRVEKLKIQRGDYSLAKMLTDKQKETAQRNAVEAPSPGMYKFQDNHLFVVVDKATDRVLVLYERYEPIGREKIRELVGNLFFDFGDPTVMAHEKTIYWAFNEKGKISEAHYRKAKKEGRPLKTLATVKLDSSHKIMDKSGPVENGSVYYIISSEPILKLHQNQNS